MRISIEGSHIPIGINVEHAADLIRDITDPNTGTPTPELDDAKPLLRWSPGAWHSTVTLRQSGVIEVCGFLPDARLLSDTAQLLRSEGFEVVLTINPVTFSWWLVRLHRPYRIDGENPIAGIPPLPVARVKPCFLRATPDERRRAMTAGVYYEQDRGLTLHQLLDGELSCA